MKIDTTKLIPFDLSKAKHPGNPDGLEVYTRKGQKARIIFTEAQGFCPVIALIYQGYGNEDVINYTKHGERNAYEGIRDDLDLMLMPRTIERWISV